MWQLFKLSLAALALSGVVGLVSGPALARHRTIVAVIGAIAGSTAMVF